MVFLKKVACLAIVLFISLPVSGCGKSNEIGPEPEKMQDTINENIEETGETASVEDLEIKENRHGEWPYCIIVEPEETETQGNILGYTLLRVNSSVAYVRDDDYLVDKSAVGKGVFQRENISETEALVGKLMTAVIESRGEVRTKEEPYFSDWAIQQLQKTDWEMLDEGWQINPYEYDREYAINNLYGATGYDFVYIFYPDEECRNGEETQTVTAWLTVNPEGIIDSVRLEINQVQATYADMKEYVNEEGLFDDVFHELIIEGGRVCEGKVKLDFYDYFSCFLNPDEMYEPKYPGLLAAADAAVSAENLGNIFINLLESRGKELKQYESLHAFENVYSELKNREWNQLEENWRADAAYDCYYVDRIMDMGYVVFRYCFYPDYDEMNLEEAKVVILECYVDVVDGEIGCVELKMISMTKEEYNASVNNKKEQEQRSLVIKEGKQVTENEKQPITVRRTDFIPCLLRDYQFTAPDENGIPSVEEISIWGMEERTKLAGYLGEKFLQDFDDNVGKIEALFHEEEAYGEYICSLGNFRNRAGENWKVDTKYDCFYVECNEREECVHLKYYFYPVIECGIGEGYVMALDVYLSGNGIEDIVMNKYITEDSISVNFLQ